VRRQATDGLVEYTGAHHCKEADDMSEAKMGSRSRVGDAENQQGTSQRVDNSYNCQPGMSAVTWSN